MIRSQLNKFTLICMILCLSLVLGAKVPINAQSGSLPRCKLFAVDYHFPVSGWQWLNHDQVAFSVTNGLPSGGIYPKRLVWYQYQPSLDKLEKRTSSPFEKANIPAPFMGKLKDIQSRKDGTYEGIHKSASGNKVIYPRQTGNQISYWFVDLATGLELNLGVPTVDPQQRELEVFWFPDEQQFIVGQGLNTYVDPIQIVFQERGKITSKPLADLPPLIGYGPGFHNSAFAVAGLNPGGNYIVIEPETSDSITWLFDIAKKQITTLNFYLVGDQRVAWTSNKTFVALTNLGAVEYDIDKQSTAILARPDELNLDPLAGDNSLSPDGRYALIHRWGKNGEDASAELGICTLR